MWFRGGESAFRMAVAVDGHRTHELPRRQHHTVAYLIERARDERTRRLLVTAAASVLANRSTPTLKRTMK